MSARRDDFEAAGSSTAAAVTITLDGDLDLLRADDVRARILAAHRSGVTTVQLDMAAVTFFDSSALRAVLQARQTFRQAGVELVVTERSPHVERVLEVTGTLDLLTDGPQL
ncbi:MAG TPA: STAS domain-containing protein [Acidimicrobiales bacterium]|jgi:anti-anti-sigma factor|nr:STAS domain-containing protein [Acidimicrobiales bacterium]